MMSTLSTENRRAQAGFTLVELAIVLVIIGLLLGGILKGQELIAATRVNSTVSQIKAIDAAIYTFRDSYGGIPGDLLNPGTNLPTCSNSCVADAGGALGDGAITGVPGAALNVAAGSRTEGTAFFPQLAAANLISGVLTNSTALATTSLKTPLGGTTNFRVGTAPASTLIGSLLTSSISAGAYLEITAIDPGTAVSADGTADASIAPKQASGIDIKADDGRPNTGTILGLGADVAAGPTAGCTSQAAAAAGAVTDTYNTQNTTTDCGLAVKIMQ